MKFYESEYEEALIDLLQQEGWEYTHGGDIRRNNRDILISRDLRQYLQERYPALEANDLDEIISHLQHTGGQTHFDILRNTYRLLRDGYRYTRHSDGEIFDIEYVDFETPSDNRFRCVNQYEVGYGMQGDRRIPDVLLFVNGIPLCIFELKDPTDATATIADAYRQIHTRYMRDIPHLLRYCPLSCISDATANNTKLGTTYTPYEHYYAWKKVNNEDKAAEKGLDQVRTIVSGVYAPVRFLEIVRDYIYFPDEVYPKQEEVVCRSLLCTLIVVAVYFFDLSRVECNLGDAWDVFQVYGDAIINCLLHRIAIDNTTKDLYRFIYGRTSKADESSVGEGGTQVLGIRLRDESSYLFSLFG